MRLRLIQLQTIRLIHTQTLTEGQPRCPRLAPELVQGFDGRCFDRTSVSADGLFEYGGQRLRTPR